MDQNNPNINSENIPNNNDSDKSKIIVGIVIAIIIVVVAGLYFWGSIINTRRTESFGYVGYVELNDQV